MRGFIAKRLGVPEDEAHRIQKDYFRRYGLTVRGLMLEHGVEPDDFNAHVHDVDLRHVTATTGLPEAIAALPGRRIVHSNADRGHVGRILARIGLSDAFDAVHSLESLGYVPKPSPESYASVLEAEGADPTRAAMFEDIPANLAEPARLGMRTVMVGTEERGEADFATTDLAGFLRAVT